MRFPERFFFDLMRRFEKPFLLIRDINGMKVSKLLGILGLCCSAAQLTFADDVVLDIANHAENLNETKSNDIDQQNWLDRHGIYPHLRLQNNAFTSLNYGIGSGKVESISSYSLGLDLDLDRLVGWKNASFHLETVRNFDRQNNELGPSIGSFPLAQIPQNAPKRDVPVFTYQQKLLDNQLDFEVGRKNIVWYFIDDFFLRENFSRLSQFTWMTLPPPYATWSGKVKYDFNDAFFAQLGIWDYDVTKWGYDGWDWRTSGSTGNTTLATVGWNNKDPKRGGHLELTYYKINASENDPYYTVHGTSQVFNANDEVLTHKGADSFILSGGHHLMDLDSKWGSSLYGYGSIGVNTDPWIASGVASDAYVGVTLLDPFGWQGDTIGLKLAVNRLTASKQKYLEDMNIANGGTGYKGKRTSEFVQVYGHFNLGAYVSWDPYLAYGFNPNSYYSPSSLVEPKEGWIAGSVLIFDIGKLLKDKI